LSSFPFSPLCAPRFFLLLPFHGADLSVEQLSSSSTSPWAAGWNTALPRPWIPSVPSPLPTLTSSAMARSSPSRLLRLSSVTSSRSRRATLFPPTSVSLRLSTSRRTRLFSRESLSPSQRTATRAGTRRRRAEGSTRGTLELATASRWPTRVRRLRREGRRESSSRSVCRLASAPLPSRLGVETARSARCALSPFSCFLSPSEI
jgi:hypothetical protein